MSSEAAPCPCCGYLVFSEGPGSYEICPICFWEDDGLQLECATSLSGGANHTTLYEAQRNFAALGACEERSLDDVRLPDPGDRRDPSWRMIDLNLDEFETWSDPGRKSAPSLDESLYYWRASFWRLKRRKPD